MPLCCCLGKDHRDTCPDQICVVVPALRVVPINVALIDRTSVYLSVSLSHGSTLALLER